MFHSFCFPRALQVPGNGAGGKVKIRRIPIESAQRGGKKKSGSFMKHNIFSVFPVVIF